MDNSIPAVIFERVPTYFVGMTGTLNIGATLTIPRLHRREGDRQDNEQIRVIVQADTQIAGQITPALQVYDLNGNICAAIYSPVAWQIETADTIKIVCGPDTYGTGATGIVYRIIVFYRRPT